MKSKFKNKIVFYNDNFYRNTPYKSPYWFILDVDKQHLSKLSGGDRIVISYIDIKGRIKSLTTTPHYLYKKLEILDINTHKHLVYDFIKNIFGG